MRPKQTFDELKLDISSAHGKLSKRLRQIAEFAIAEPDHMALETVAAIAARADVQPSSLIRFAKHFGYDGFSDMQLVFRSRLIDRASNYSQRIRQSEPGVEGYGGARAILERFIEADSAAIHGLKAEIDGAALERGVRLLAQAEIIGVAAQRRSFPIAVYFAYALSHLGRRAHLIDGVGGMGQEQLRLMSPRDVLLAVSFKPYAPETIDIVEQAASRDVSILAITDTALSPLAPLAKVCFEVAEAQVRGIRSPTATMCLAVSLVVGLGAHVERGAKRAPRGRALNMRA